MADVFVTRDIPEEGIEILRNEGHIVTISKKDGVLTKGELIEALQEKQYEAVLCLLTDTIDGEVFDVAPYAKIFANYAVGYNNIDMEEAQKRGIIITNTPDVLTNTVAEYTFALILSLLHRIPEADRFTREGRYEGWAPKLLLGNDVHGKVLGVLGAGRIGQCVAMHARTFGAEVIYYDIQRDEVFEKESGAVFNETPEALLETADIISVHVPLLESTHHLINAERLNLMKESAYLVNTSRGPVVDENALVTALQQKHIRGAALDVFEYEPKLAAGLRDLENVIITPHIASATEETRQAMSRMAGQSVVDALQGKTPAHIVK